MNRRVWILECKGMTVCAYGTELAAAQHLERILAEGIAEAKVYSVPYWPGK